MFSVKHLIGPLKPFSGAERSIFRIDQLRTIHMEHKPDDECSHDGDQHRRKEERFACKPVCDLSIVLPDYVVDFEFADETEYGGERL